MASLRIVREQDLTAHDRSTLLERRQSLEHVMAPVRDIMHAVQTEGDGALRRYTRQFDGASLDDLQVSPEEFAAAQRAIEPAVRDALQAAIEAVRTFHQAQLPREEALETAPGVRVWREWRPIERVGLYVPGGRGAYPSSVIMLGLPASIAGCPQVVMCTPPGPDGAVPAATLVAADLVGIHRVFKLGGAQAIAAMTYGTESVPWVDKLFGAGNAYVTAAKLLAFPARDLDAPAGPSELLILAEPGADPAWIAADVLSDVEHGPDSAALVVTTSFDLAEQIQAEVERQLCTLPRQDLARRALEGCSAIVVTETLDAAIRVTNDYAPEHLEIITRAPRDVLARIQHAGSVFLGPYAPNAAGDYATGTNHVLPTSRYARTFSPVSVNSFGRMLQCQELSAEGLASLSRIVGQLARSESLEGHARAVEIRLPREMP